LGLKGVAHGSGATARAMLRVAARRDDGDGVANAAPRGATTGRS